MVMLNILRSGLSVCVDSFPLLLTSVPLVGGGVGGVGVTNFHPPLTWKLEGQPESGVALLGTIGERWRKG